MAWPSNIFAPKEQQLEGLRCILKRVSPQQFIRSMDNLKREGFMSKSSYHQTIKNMRHAIGMSYEEYLKLRKNR